MKTNSLEKTLMLKKTEGKRRCEDVYECDKYFCSGLHGGGGLVTKSCPTVVTPWTRARQAFLSIGFSRQEYWSGLPFPSTGDLPDSGIEPGSDSLPTELWGKPIQVYIFPVKYCYVWWYGIFLFIYF